MPYRYRWIAIAGLFAAAVPVFAAPVLPAAPPAAASGAMVVVEGVVPTEEARQAILARAREVYGAARVVDQLGVGDVVAPPNWSQNVQKLISPDLQRVARGQLKISGNAVELNGEIGDEASRRQLVSHLSSQLNPTYTVRDGLRIGAAGQQAVDAALANRVIEFEPGNATLTARGTEVLEQLLPVLQQLKGRPIEVIGHTDSQGSRAQNTVLSAARADAVKAYLGGKGIALDQLRASGAGPDRPVASNDTPEGRARNRRIELRVLQ